VEARKGSTGENLRRNFAANTRSGRFDALLRKPRAAI
jgi:hypothetical protein